MSRWGHIIYPPKCTNYLKIFPLCYVSSYYSLKHKKDAHKDGNSKPQFNNMCISDKRMFMLPVA